jgi:hypothetical protein
MEGFIIPKPVCIHVFSDALPLEGVLTWVTRVSNNVSLKTSCISCVYASPTVDLCVERHITVVLRRQNTDSTLKKINPQFLLRKVL